jgi:uncharacterized membrane protein
MRTYQKKSIQQKKQGHFLAIALVCLFLAIIGYLQNKLGQASDVRGFFVMRFGDNLHTWPYQTYESSYDGGLIKPIEYPVITGTIIWLLTYLSPFTGDPILNYFNLNVVFNAILYISITYYVFKISGRRAAYLFCMSPAVLVSLNLNWDLWAILPMMISIYTFKIKKFRKSAVFLAIATATKFFPVILLFPISAYFIRMRLVKQMLQYLCVFGISWLLINLPIAIHDFSGWFYFYQFNFKRGLGEGSIFTIPSKLGLDFSFPMAAYIILNGILFVLFLALLLFRKKINSLQETAYFAMFVFMFFGKQYSMQYILWLAPLAAIAFDYVKRIQVRVMSLTYVIWQISEFWFSRAYFSNLLTNNSAKSYIWFTFPTSDSLYAGIASLRYLILFFFTLFLGYSIWYSTDNVHIASKFKRRKEV